MKKSVNRICVFFTFLILLSAGCAGNQEAQIQKHDVDIAKDERSDKIQALVLQASQAKAVDPNADYRIGKEDVLEIEVFQVDELKKTVRVGSQGYIGLPLIGQVNAKGLTTSELEKEIAAKLDQYLQEPHVSIYVKEYHAQRIGVMGAVKEPKIYVVAGQKYLLEMISMAGGITREAGGICYIVRPVSEEIKGPETQTIAVDLNDLLEKGNMELNIPVFTGDVINVPKGGVVFVDGAVEKPGAYPLSAKTTLMQAIAMAGGVKFEAEQTEIKVYRPKEDGTHEVITTDYDAVQNSAAKDFALKQNDIIVVPKSGFKTLLSGIGKVFSGISASIGKGF